MHLRARWVLPISSPPIDDGWVAIDGGRIVGVGQRRGSARGADAERVQECDLGHVALMPGLVNAHTHLELSYAAGAVPAAACFTDWVRELMALRRTHPDPAAAPILAAARDAIVALHLAGTAAVGDISNTLVTVPLLSDSPLAAAVFFEVLRFRAADAAAVLEEAIRRVRAVAPGPRVRVWPAAHAPYSVSPALFRALRAWLDVEPLARTSVHLAESPQETELLTRGSGPFRDLLHDVGAWDDGWTPPGCGPVEYLDRLGFLTPRTVVVHGVQMDGNDLDRLTRTGATIVTCPRSNRHVGVGDPPISRFYASGLPVAIGTDSLGSAPDLNVFGELAALRALAPAVPAGRLLESATLLGARALGCENRLGSIDPGKAAAVIAVEVPPGVDDVEEYLVSGIEPAQVRWATPRPIAPAPGAYSWN